MERLGAQDAVFLAIENEFNHMSIALLSIFEGPAPKEKAVEKMIAAKLHLAPRLRQRLRTIPLHAGTPVWCDDPHFNLRYHLRHTALPAAGTDRQLKAMVGRLMSQQLDRTKPLWEMWLIEGLHNGSWAILFKIHHCMADGIAAVNLMESLFDHKARVRRNRPEPWKAEQQPAGADLLRSAIAERLNSPAILLDALRNAAGKPGEVARNVSDYFDGLWALRRPTDLEVESSLNGPIGVHRGWNWASADLSRIQQIRTRHQCTVNDVVLSAIAMGFRKLLKKRQEAVEDHVVRALIPVSTRAEEEQGISNNRVSAMFVELPVGIARAGECLDAVAEQTRGLKRHHQSVPGKTMMTMSILLPPALMDAETRFFTSEKFHWVQTVATNVPGPKEALYAAGREMQSVYLYVPIISGVRIGVAIFSYRGEITFAVTSDYEHVGDADVLCSGIEQAIADLSD